MSFSNLTGSHYSGILKGDVLLHGEDRKEQAQSRMLEAFPSASLMMLEGRYTTLKVGLAMIVLGGKVQSPFIDP